jgi:hypothetical protein
LGDWLSRILKILSIRVPILCLCVHLLIKFSEFYTQPYEASIFRLTTTTLITAARPG